MRIRQNAIVFFSMENTKKGSEQQECGILWFWRENELILSRFLAVRTVGSRRSKKQSRSTQRGLHVDTDLVEFQQLQDVGIFSYLCYSLTKSHVNG